MAGTLQIRTADDKFQKLVHLDLRVDIQISTAFVTVTSDWIVGKDGWYTLELPINHRCTITHIEITTDNILVQSAVIPEEEFKAHFRAPQNVEFNDKLFNFPFELRGSKGAATQRVKVFLTYFESMSFNDADRKYSFTFPMRVRPEIIDRNMIPSLHAFVIINTATEKYQWGSSTHQLQVISRGGPTNISLDCQDFYPRINHDFEINYVIITNEILCSLLLNEFGLDTYDPRQTFCVNIHPPPEATCSTGCFGRKIVFLIDVSGSMTGDPIQQATAALQAGLVMMKPTDVFTIIAFNHTTSVMSQMLTQANQQSIQTATNWVSSLIASGGTDIMTPTQMAVNILKSTPDDGLVSMVFLITDGAVENETAIFHWVTSNCGEVRVHTLGIGRACNAYFLKMVALAGRGINDQIMSTHYIQQQLVNMLRSANTPMLTNVEVLLPVQNSQYEIFPNPIPDLFCGSPLVISGKTSQYFDHVLIRGVLPNNQPFQTRVYPLMVPIYLHGIFVKQRLDYLVGQAWLTKSNDYKQEAITLSCRTQIPSPYTTMVSYAVPPNKKPERQLSASEIAAISVGGVVCFVGIALTFGVADSVLSILGNGIGEMFNGGGGGGGGVDGNCCDCDCDCSGGGCHGCGNCDCGHCCDCGSCDCSGCDLSGCDCNC